LKILKLENKIIVIGGKIISTLTNFIVTYDGNGYTSGAVPSDSNQYGSGDDVTVLDQGTMINSGGTFNCWNSQSNGLGTDYLADSTFKIYNNVTLYAKWNVSISTDSDAFSTDNDNISVDNE
jgi:hypothetical protein